METLADLIARHAKPGHIEWIGLRPLRLHIMKSVASASLTGTGLQGDHSRAGKRALTLIQAEHLPVIAALVGLPHLGPETLRRNLVVSGMNLNALRGRQLRIGPAIVEVTGICAPCSRMEEALGHGGYTAMRGHGGWCARVVETGEISVGDPVAPV
ncbi:MOSC domain-containing protein [Gymnodinialimonas sp. 2305UL16-5]|uniref:MOSC domain-containing protein n=1 Tax=Gymnodinialimonas mytili TaxID=3126503 RepID=UPI0030AEAA92